MIITIPFKTPSVNHLYFNFRNRRILTKEARELKKTIKELVFECMDKERLLEVEVFIYENWFCKNGSVARKDAANREKFLIDAVFDALGIDDKYIFKQTLIKMQDEKKEKAVIRIEQYDTN